MILVTGGTGLLGAHLLYKLAKNNESVRAIYRTQHKLDHVKSVFATYTDNYQTMFNDIEWMQADLLDIPSLSEAFKDINYVYHCAAFVSFEPNKFQLLRKSNIEGTANIVNQCIANNVKKLCHVSSIATVRDSANNEDITETSVWNSEDDHSVYAITKYGAEMEVWRASQEGLDTVIVNPGVILGAGIWHYGTGSLFKKAHKGLKFYTSGNIALVDVEDVVSIMIKLTKSDVKNERFILVAEQWSYKTFFEALSKSVNVKPPKKLAGRSLLTFLWKLDWLKHKLTGKQRLLTKHIVQSLTTEKHYNNNKIKTTLDYSFKPVDKSIETIGAFYLK